MKKLLGILVTLFLYGTAVAGPVTLTLNENQRLYRNTGIITLTDPQTGELLGTYNFATGGYGNGSAPFGLYLIGDYQGPDEDPLNIGPRWLIRNPGLDQGKAIDPGIPGQTKPRVRTELELHMAKATNGTLGCIAVLGGQKVYDRFLEQLRYILKQQDVSFVLEANPNGVGVMEEVIAYYPHIVKRSFKSKEGHGKRHSYNKNISNHKNRGHEGHKGKVFTPAKHSKAPLHHRHRH